MNTPDVPATAALRPDVTVRIDRIVLEGVGLSPERAEQMRSRVETELRSLLQHEPLLLGSAGREMRRVSRVDGRELSLGATSDEMTLARELAARIAGTLRTRE